MYGAARDKPHIFLAFTKNELTLYDFHSYALNRVIFHEKNWIIPEKVVPARIVNMELVVRIKDHWKKVQ